ncbi:MAG: hypothetical protein JWR88_832 [Pseudonocardia sp.]|jgi:uncharacterized protein YqeY|nr:hypothetical protein [Pseudonocardia sp.]
MLRRALVDAMKARDSVAVSALRSALAAIENAEAVDAADGAPAGVGDADPHVAGSIVGLGAGEVSRRTLTPAEVVATVRAELDERLAAAVEYQRLGRREHAERLRGEAGVLSRQLAKDPGAEPTARTT